LEGGREVGGVATVAEELNGVLSDYFYGDLAEQMLITIHRSYGEADDLLGSMFMAPEAHDLIGHVRRAFIEQGVKTQAASIPNVRATSEPVIDGRSYFTKITHGKLTLTVSASESSSSLPRYAKYRKGYAELQLPLFGKRPEVYDGPFYAIVTHGPSYGAARSEGPIGFCQIGFPDHRYKSFVHQVDLRRYYAPLFERLHMGEEIIIGQATAELRERIAREMGS
jgi:hypothetical protein